MNRDYFFARYKKLIIAATILIIIGLGLGIYFLFIYKPPVELPPPPDTHTTIEITLQDISENEESIDYISIIKNFTLTDYTYICPMYTLRYSNNQYIIDYVSDYEKLSIAQLDKTYFVFQADGTTTAMNCIDSTFTISLPTLPEFTEESVFIPLEDGSIQYNDIIYTFTDTNITSIKKVDSVSENNISYTIQIGTPDMSFIIENSEEVSANIFDMTVQTIFSTIK